MKVIIVPAQAGVDGELEAVDNAANQVELNGIYWTPYFFKADSQAPILMLSVRDDNGNVISRSMLQISGRTGALSLQDRTKPVKPSFVKENADGAGPANSKTG